MADSAMDKNFLRLGASIGNKNVPKEMDVIELDSFNIGLASNYGVGGDIGLKDITEIDVVMDYGPAAAELLKHGFAPVFVPKGEITSETNGIPNFAWNFSDVWLIYCEITPKGQFVARFTIKNLKIKYGDAKPPG